MSPDDLYVKYPVKSPVIASDQISRSPEPFGFAQDKLREGVAIRHAVSLRGTFAEFTLSWANVLSIDSAKQSRSGLRLRSLP